MIKSRIFRRQFFSFFFMILVTFLVITFVLFTFTRVSFEDQQFQIVEGFRKEVVSSFNSWLETNRNRLKTHVAYLGLLNPELFSTDEVTRLLKENAGLGKRFTDFILVDRTGRVVNSTGGPSDIILADREYVAGALQGKSVTTGILKGRRTGTPFMALSEPVYFKQEVSYILAGIMTLEEIKKTVEGLKLGDLGHAYLVDSDGVLLTDSTYITDFMKNDLTANRNQYKVKSYGVDEVMRKKSGTATYRDFQGKRVFGSYAWSSEFNLGVMVEFQESDVLRPLTGLTVFILVLAAVVILIGGLLAYLLSVRLVRPINVLIEATQNIIRQNYQNELDMRTNTELDMLVDSFNGMEKAIRIREERLRAQNEELARQKAEALEASRLKSQFLSNMSHELRTPLNSIIGFTSRVLKKTEDILPPVQQENLRIVKQEGQHLLELLNSLLDYSKIEAGKMTVNIEHFDLAEVVREAESMILPIAQEKQIGFEKRLFSTEAIPIESDRMKIKQILINLLGNAFKYSEKGTVTLSVDKSDSGYSVRIKDEGIGIAPEDIGYIFDEFRQVDGSYTRKAGGTGLGLAITKRFAELLGGSVGVESVRGIGSEFTVFMPIRYSRCESCVPEAGTEPSSSGGDRKRRKVICIDDDKNIHTLFRQYLEEDCFDITSLYGTEDVFKVIKEIRPDIILLDIVFSKSDTYGIQLLAELKGNPATKDIPVIMISFLQEKNLAFSMHADDFLIKPVTQETLVETVRHFLNRKQGEARN